MTAWGMVAVCAIGGGAAGPLLEQASRRVVRPAPAAAGAATADAVGDGADAAGASAGAVDDGAAVDAAGAPAGAPVAAAAAPAAASGAPGAMVVVGGPGERVVATPSGTAGPAALNAALPVGPWAAGAPREDQPARVADAIAAALAVAALCALAAVRLGAEPPLAAYCALFGGLVAISFVDLRVGLVPRRLLYPTLAIVALGLVAASADAGAWRPLVDAVVGGAVAFVVFYAIWWIYPKGMGFGDIRLAGLCGVALGFLGFPELYIGFLAAFLFGAVAGVVALARRGARRFPFAPALALGTAFSVLWGGWLGNLWLHPG